MASSRRLPVASNVSTYGNATRDYTSLATWEAATDINLVTATSGEILECYDDAASFDDAIVMAGTTTNSNYFRVLKPADGEGHDGTPNNGVTFICTSASNIAFDVKESNSQIQDIIVSTNQSIVGLFGRYSGDSVSYGEIIGCIGYDSNNLTGGCFRVGRSSTSSAITMKFINCLAINCDEGFSVKGGTGSKIYFYNCTAVECTTGFEDDSSLGTLYAKNCAAVDCTTDFSGTWTKTTCYEGDATVFVDQSGDDYHLDNSDTTCRGNGTDLSADGTYAFNDDIDGDTRSEWDIGADEYSSPVVGYQGKSMGVVPGKIMGITPGKIMGI